MKFRKLTKKEWVKSISLGIILGAGLISCQNMFSGSGGKTNTAKASGTGDCIAKDAVMNGGIIITPFDKTTFAKGDDGLIQVCVMNASKQYAHITVRLQGALDGDTRLLPDAAQSFDLNANDEKIVAFYNVTTSGKYQSVAAFTSGDGLSKGETWSKDLIVK